MTACIVKKPSEEILGNILVNQEHSGKSGIIETGSMTEITVFIICQKESKESLFKVSFDLRNEQIKNAFRIAPHTLSNVKVQFDHVLDASAVK